MTVLPSLLALLVLLASGGVPGESYPVSPLDPSLTVCNHYTPWSEGMCLVDGDGVEHGYCRRCLVGPEWDALRQELGTAHVRRDTVPVLAAGNWPSSTMMATAFRILLQELLGYDRVQVFLNKGSALAIDEVAAEGCNAINLEVWKTGEPHMLEKINDIKQTLLEGLLGTYGFEGLYVPSFLPEECTDYQILRNDGAALNKPASDGCFPKDGTVDLSEWLAPPHYNCKPGETKQAGWENSDTCVEGRWYPEQCGSQFPSPNCTEIYAVTPVWVTGWIEGLVRTLGLDASVVYLGYDGMRQTIAEMYQERKGGIYYWWEPDIVHSKFDSRKVQLPESNTECLERHHPSPDLNGMNCSFPPQTIRKYMNAATHSTNLDLGYLFDRFLIEGHDMQEMLSYYKEGGGPYDTMEDAACGYLRDGSLKWREWIRVTHDQQDSSTFPRKDSTGAPVSAGAGLQAAAEGPGTNKSLPIIAAVVGLCAAMGLILLALRPRLKMACGGEATGDVEEAAGRSVSVLGSSNHSLLKDASLGTGLIESQVSNWAGSSGSLPQVEGAGPLENLPAPCKEAPTSPGAAALTGGANLGLDGGDVTILKKVGQGGSAVVYKALWHGATVALKVQRVDSGTEILPVEARVGESLRHPNVVQQFGFELVRQNPPREQGDSWEPAESSCRVVESTLPSCSKSCPDAASVFEGLLLGVRPSDGDVRPSDGELLPPLPKLPTTPPPPEPTPNKEAAEKTHCEPCEEDESSVKLFSIMEYCAEGSLARALKKNTLSPGTAASNGLPPTPPPDGTALTLAHDVAMGMSYIHTRDVVHGDLKAANVLLVRRDASDATADCACMAKVADFGLAVQMDPGNTSTTGVFSGTVTHMAPEVLRLGRQSRAADVYAFGVLLYELFSAARPYAGKSASDIVSAVLNSGARPVMPAATPRAVIELSAACTKANPSERPTMQEVRETIAGLVQEHAMDPAPSCQLRRRALSFRSLCSLERVEEEEEEEEGDEKTVLPRLVVETKSDRGERKLTMISQKSPQKTDPFLDKTGFVVDGDIESDDEAEDDDTGTIVFELKGISEQEDADDGKPQDTSEQMTIDGTM